MLAREDHLLSLRESIGASPFSPHALAALFLYQQPFGFTALDVADELEVGAFCDAMVARHIEAGDTVTADTFRNLGARHRERAARIAALLPPVNLAGEDESVRGE